MNTPVNFELAKLLKEKGFDKRSEPYRYNKFGETTLLEGINAPNIADVVMWLYEKHGIWVSVQPNEPYIDNDWCFILYKDFKISYALEGYGSPMQSYESGIEYVLNNLI